MKVLGWECNAQNKKAKDLEDIVREYNCYTSNRGLLSRLYYTQEGDTYTCYLATEPQMAYGTNECQLIQGTLTQVYAVVRTLYAVITFEREHRGCV